MKGRREFSLRTSILVVVLMFSFFGNFALLFFFFFFDMHRLFKLSSMGNLSFDQLDFE